MPGITGLVRAATDSYPAAMLAATALLAGALAAAVGLVVPGAAKLRRSG